jgi:hypothetical protein
VLKAALGWRVVDSRNCRRKFDSKGGVLIQVVYLDACGFCTYAYIQVSPSEATGTGKRQARKEFAGCVAFS